MSKVTKAQIAETLVAKNLFKRKDSVQIVESMFELMKLTLEQGEELMISGFGKFTVAKKNPRKGRNPQTGEEMVITPRKVVTFKWSKKLKERINRE